MIVSHEKKYVFIHVPKAGGTALTDTLATHIESPGFAGDGTHIHPLLKYHAPARDIVRAFAALGWRWEDYTSFAIIRNPFETLHSDYWFHRYIGEKLFRNGPPDKLDPEYSWHYKCYESQFIELLEYCLRAYGHWDRGFYHQYCCSKKIDKHFVSRVFRYEDMAKVWAHAKHHFGLQKDMPLERINATSQVDGRERPPLREDFTPGLIKFVSRVFRDDIKRFGFTLEAAR